MVYAKLLLFGEYSILIGGSALSLPLKNFYANMAFSGNYENAERAEISKQSLLEFLEFIDRDNKVKPFVALDAFRQDLLNGLFMSSNIPMGYGVGSSGALCAAVYERYQVQFDNEKDKVGHNQLQELFASMESFFHGKSSGLDPLACFISSPLLYRKHITVLTEPMIHPEGWFLIDSGFSRKSTSFIEIFNKRCLQKSYLEDFKEQYLPYSEQLIDGILGEIPFKKDDDQFLQLLESLSMMQLSFFEEMIPEKIRSLWEEGLDSSMYYMKLLGAGGGGFFLCYTRQKLATMTKIGLNGFKIQPVIL